MELRRQGVKDLPTALKAVEALVNFTALLQQCETPSPERRRARRRSIMRKPRPTVFIGGMPNRGHAMWDVTYAKGRIACAIVPRGRSSLCL